MIDSEVEELESPKKFIEYAPIYAFTPFEHGYFVKKI